MEFLKFLLGSNQVPLYRAVSERESEMFRALLGRGFHFELDEGEPIDTFLFEALSGVAMRANLCLSPPEDAAILGTFELRDRLSTAASAEGWSSSSISARTH